MVELLSTLVSSTDLTQAGAVVVAIALVALQAHQTNQFTRVTDTLGKRIENIAEQHSIEIRELRELSTSAIRADAEAKVKLTEALTRQTSSLERLSHIIEVKL